MKSRTLLLGTAAIFAAADGAGAADLAVAEPVDYVKVCDAYGVGYWYIPGTDTCLRVGGYVKLNVYGYSDPRYLNIAGLAVEPGAPVNGVDRGVDVSRAFPYFDDYRASWSFVTEAGVTVTAQSMTDYGPLTAFIEFRGLSDNAVFKGTSRPSAGDIDLGGPLAYVDSMYLKLGPVTAGFLDSIFDYGGGFTYDLRGDFRHDTRQDQLTFAWNWGGWGFGFGVADPRDQRGGSEFQTGDYPDIIAVIYGAGGGFDWKGSVAVADTIFGTAFGGQLGGTFTWASGAAIRLQGAVANSEGAYWVSNSYGPQSSGGTAWSILASGIWYWTPAFSTALTGGYSDAGFTSSELWAFSAGAYWTIAKNATSGIEFQYLDGEAIDDSWLIKAELKRSFGS